MDVRVADIEPLRQTRMPLRVPREQPRLHPVMLDQTSPTTAGT